MIPSDVNNPTFAFDNLPLHWQMTRCEKYALYSLLDMVKPDAAIEIGTYRGGSLQVIAAHAKHVYAIDVDPACEQTLTGQFENVTFLTGDSNNMIPAALDLITRSGQSLMFVLIDGGHHAETVRKDVAAVLQHVPDAPMYIICHDSFHPPCRQGIIEADWTSCPYVHYVEVDFVPGVFHYESFDTARPRSMYGGLALAQLKPQPRTGPLTIHQSQRHMYDIVYARSRYAPTLRNALSVLRSRFLT